MVHFYFLLLPREFLAMRWKFVAMRKQVATVCQASLMIRLHFLSIVQELQMMRWRVIMGQNNGNWPLSPGDHFLSGLGAGGVFGDGRHPQGLFIFS